MNFPKKASTLSEILANNGYKARIVGGYVRDMLRGYTSNEIDMATDAKPEIIQNLCEKNNIKCIPTGLKHGTVTVIINGEHIEITTLRRDLSCDGRHAEVLFTDDWEEDAKRRDFTINAMYLDSHLRLYDFFSGEKDLQENIVRFIGDPEERIHEDYLRIMRYFRFLGCFDSLKLHQDSFDAAVVLSKNLYKISHERIQSELLKIFSSKSKNIPIKLMLVNKVFEKIGLNFTYIDTDKLYFGDNPLINIAIMMRLSNMTDTTILKDLKFSNAEQKLIGSLLKYQLDNHFMVVLNKMINMINTTKDIHNKMQEIGKDIYIRLFEIYFGIYIKSLTSCNYSEILNNFSSTIGCIKLKEFPVTSHDIMYLGYSGRDIGDQLLLAKQLWVESDCTLNKTLLIKLIKT